MSPDLEYIRAEAARITNALSPADWNRAPGGRWSPAQIMEHLILTYTATTKGAMRTMQSGEIVVRKQVFRERVAELLVIGIGFLPSGRQASKQNTPTAAPEPDPLRRFNDALVAMDATLTDAERRFGTRAKMLEHPVLGPLTAQEWRRFHRVHARHHFKQMMQRARA